MKRLFSLLLCLSIAFSLAACTSAKSPAPSGADTSSPAAVSSADGSAAAESGADESAAQEQAADASASETPAATGDVQVTLTKEEGTVTGDDGTVVVDYNYQQPTVTLPDAAAQEAVQKDLDAEIQEFLDSVKGDMAEAAMSDIAYRQEELADGSTSAAFEVTPYHAELGITVARADASVISLVLDDSGYSGGAHGWDLRYTLNYDAKTGERLTFAMLGEGFRDKANELVLAEADKVSDELNEDYAKELPYVVADGTESSDEVTRAIYPELYEGDDPLEPQEGNLTAEFYLNDEGVVFIAGQYVMKPYAGGILEFTVPYESFDGVMAEQYLPQ